LPLAEECGGSQEEQVPGSPFSTIRSIGLALCASLCVFAQTNSLAPGKSTQAQASSTVNYSASSGTIDIRNVAYEVTATSTPGHPHQEWVLLRKTIQSKEVIGDIGVEGTVTVEAWPLGTDIRQKPLYSVSESGTEVQTVDADLFVVDRRTEEVSWWSVHNLGTGRRLFDTYVPLVSFSIARDTVTTRYVGLEIPEDDNKDKRLTEPHVVAVVAYASADKIVREALLTCDDPKRASLLRSLADSTQMLSDIETPPDTSRNKDAPPRHSLKLSIHQDYPSPPTPIEIDIPITRDDLDLANAKLPPGLHLTAWKRL
jgi:hypothetical protein